MTRISLSQVRVAKPCPMTWSEMRGDERVRFCDQCKLNVYNLSAMSRAEAEQLVTEKEGRLCISYYQRADGTIITQDCPVGWRLAKKTARRVAAVAAVAIIALLQAACVLARSDRSRRSASLRDAQPFKWVQTVLSTSRGGVVRVLRPCRGAMLPIAPRP